MDKLIIAILCHLLGDYVLQNDFIAKTKGENWYHLFVHSALYCFPFLLIDLFNYNEIFFLFTTHVLIDALKARYNKTSYVQDQVLHYVVLAFMLV